MGIKGKCYERGGFELGLESQVKLSPTQPQDQTQIQETLKEQTRRHKIIVKMVGLVPDKPGFDFWF